MNIAYFTHGLSIRRGIKRSAFARSRFSGYDPIESFFTAASETAREGTIVVTKETTVYSSST